MNKQNADNSDAESAATSGTVYNDYPGEQAKIVYPDKTKYTAIISALNALKSRLESRSKDSEKLCEMTSQTVDDDIEEIFECSSHLESSALMFLLENQDLRADLSLADARCHCLGKRLEYIRTLLQSLQQESSDEFAWKENCNPANATKKEDVAKVYYCSNETLNAFGKKPRSRFLTCKEVPKKKERLRGGQTDWRMKSQTYEEGVDIYITVHEEGPGRKPPLCPKRPIRDFGTRSHLHEVSTLKKPSSVALDCEKQIISPAILLSPPKQTHYPLVLHKSTETKSLEETGIQCSMLDAKSTQAPSPEMNKPKKTAIRFHSRKKSRRIQEDSSKSSPDSRMASGSKRISKDFMISSIRGLEEEFTGLSRKCEDIVGHLSNIKDYDEERPRRSRSNEKLHGQVNSIPTYCVERHEKQALPGTFSTSARQNETVQIVTTVTSTRKKAPVDVMVTSNNISEPLSIEIPISQTVNQKGKTATTRLTREDLYWD